MQTIAFHAWLQEYLAKAGIPCISRHTALTGRALHRTCSAFPDMPFIRAAAASLSAAARGALVLASPLAERSVKSVGM